MSCPGRRSRPPEYAPRLPGLRDTLPRSKLSQGCSTAPPPLSSRSSHLRLLRLPPPLVMLVLPVRSPQTAMTRDEAAWACVLRRGPPPRHMVALLADSCVARSSRRRRTSDAAWAQSSRRRAVLGQQGAGGGGLRRRTLPMCARCMPPRTRTPSKNGTPGQRCRGPCRNRRQDRRARA